MTEQLASLVAELREFGCSDGYCVLRGPAKGMHTNGGCRCLDRPHPKVRWLLKQILMHLRSEATPENPAASRAGRTPAPTPACVNCGRSLADHTAAAPFTCPEFSGSPTPAHREVSDG